MRSWLIVGLVLATVVVAFRSGSTGTASLALTANFNTNHDCSFCHGVHGTNADQLLNDANVEALCLSCHGLTGPSSLKADVHVYTNSTCQDCHVSHSNVANWLGGTNLKLVRDSVVDPLLGVDRPVVFESRGTNVGDPSLHSFCDGDEDGNGIWDGACDTCHTNTGRHKYPESGSHSHQQGKTCTRSGCHEHASQFLKN